MSYLEVYREGGLFGRKWRWRRKAENGKTIAAGGQGFTTKWSAKRSASREYPSDEVREP
jgi:uncharacterized protein YegP (UPF0339 family)